MKIFYFSHYYTPEGNAPATRVSSLSRKWAESGHDVVAITCAPNVPHGKVYEGYKNTWWPQKQDLDGVKVIRVWTWIAPNKGTVRRIANYVSYMISATLFAVTQTRPDVFIATSPQFFCGWAGVLYSIWLKLTGLFTNRKTVFVLEIRDIWPESIGAVDAIRNPWILWVLQLLEAWMYQMSDHIVTVGKGYRGRLIERGVANDKISVVMNGFDSDLMSSDSVDDNSVDDSALRKHWRLEGKFVCGYIGTIGMACGLDIYLRAGRLLKQLGHDDIVLVAVGDGAVREELQMQCQAERLDNVLFVGLQPKKSMQSWLKLTDVSFIHLRKTPLFETVIPSKIFESAGMKRPIIIGVKGEASELVQASGGGVSIEPEDEKDFVANLVKMKESPAIRAAMGESGCKYVLTHFDRIALANEYLEILKQLSAKQPLRATLS